MVFHSHSSHHVHYAYVGTFFVPDGNNAYILPNTDCCRAYFVTNKTKQFRVLLCRCGLMQTNLSMKNAVLQAYWSVDW